MSILPRNKIIPVVKKEDLRAALTNYIGKVHGSLTRAGKVRNQTPKAEKQERRRKQITGRAKKRQQYNKRFLSEDAQNPRRKGPNAGSGRK